MQAVSVSEPIETASIRLHPIIPQRLLSLADIAVITGVSIPALRAWQYSGRLPKPIKLGKLQRWEPGTISQWLRTKGATDNAPSS